MINTAIILVTAIALLLVGYLTAISSKDIIRLLISLELMFGAVFLSLLPLFSVPALSGVAFGLAVVTIFASSSELIILIAAIIAHGRNEKTISMDSIASGGDDA
jgi:NADH-quinone oxidoreductase subunit K